MSATNKHFEKVRGSKAKEVRNKGGSKTGYLKSNVGKRENKDVMAGK